MPSSEWEITILIRYKSDLARRDVDLLQAFPVKALRVAFSVTTQRDETAALFEPAAPRPSRRLAAARALKEAGLTVGLLINPILPYVTERDLPALLEIAEESRLDFIAFDTLHYLRGHVGGKVRRVYEQLGQKARERLRGRRLAFDPDPLQLPPDTEGEIFVNPDGDYVISIVSGHPSIKDDLNVQRELEIKVTPKEPIQETFLMLPGDKKPKRIQFRREVESIRTLIPEYKSAALIELRR